jgi:hypothetical protein
LPRIEGFPLDVVHWHVEQCQQWQHANRLCDVSVPITLPRFPTCATRATDANTAKSLVAG